MREISAGEIRAVWCCYFIAPHSMSKTWGNSRETMAEGAARALNETLLELLFTSQGEPGKARHYFDVGMATGCGRWPGVRAWSPPSVARSRAAAGRTARTER